jgi:predicted nucleic acid-binding protein
VSLVSKPKYYWDACSWIGLINQESNKLDSLRHIIEEAQKGKVEIWTSTFTLAEVFKRKCSGDLVGLDATNDQAFEDYLEQEFVQRVQVDSDVATAARRLLRKFPSIKKPQDAIHAATAALNNVDELHTFDGSDLLPMDGQIPMPNGKKLKICKPPLPPDPNKGTLFESLSVKEEGHDEDGKKATSGG